MQYTEQKKKETSHAFLHATSKLVSDIARYNYYLTDIRLPDAIICFREARWLSGRALGSVVRNLLPPCCVLEQDTLLTKSTVNTQEAVAPS